MFKLKDFTLTTGVLLGMGAVIAAYRFGEVLAQRRLAEKPSRTIEQLIRQTGLPWHENGEEDSLPLEVMRQYLDGATYAVLGSIPDLTRQEREAFSTWVAGQWSLLCDRFAAEGSDAPLSISLFRPSRIGTQEE